MFGIGSKISICRVNFSCFRSMIFGFRIYPCKMRVLGLSKFFGGGGMMSGAKSTIFAARSTIFGKFRIDPISEAS